LVDAEVFASQLTKLIIPLRAAATLAGVPATAHHDIGGADAILLPLVCDPGEPHRRRIWEAWATEGRCRRWSALVALGTRIRAWPAAELDTFEPYRSPRPLEHRIRPGKGDAFHAGYENYLADPEDPDYREEPEPVKTRRSARLLAR